MGSTNCARARKGGEVVWFWRNTLDAIWHDKYVRFGPLLPKRNHNHPHRHHLSVIIVIIQGPGNDYGAFD